jgi:succinate-semialdehyde dehydrogenase/glutarate-semialdehyde dehydrogenase
MHCSELVYVTKKVVEEFTTKLAKVMGSLKMAPGTTAGAQVVASVSVKERNKIAQLVDAFVTASGNVRAGSKLSSRIGALYSATALTVKNDNSILN